MLTEQLPVPQPVVVGLLREAVAAGPARQRALTGVLGDFCRWRELRLTEVITDDGTGPDALLARVAEHAHLYAVVLPTIAHLGSRADADRRLRCLADAGIRLLVARGRCAERRRSGRDFGTLQDPLSGTERVRHPMEPISRTVMVRFPADRAGVGSVRRWARRAALPELGLDAEELDDIAGDVLVVLSELATNAVVHGCGGNGRAGVALSAALRLTGDGSSLRVCVSDPGAGLPVVRAADGEAVGGRGLALVLALADRFGVDPLAGGGKSVWAEFDLPVPALAVARAPGGPAGGAGAAAGAGGAGTNTGGGLTRTPQRPPGEGGLRPGHGSRRSDTAPRPPHHRTGTRSGELRWPVGELGRLEGARPPLGPGPELGRGCAPWATRTRAGDSIQLIASGTGSRPSFPLHEATPLATQAVTAPRSAAIA